MSLPLTNSLLRAWKSWRLKREGRQLMASFFATTEALGMSPYSSRQTPENTARLVRVHAIRDELRQLNFGHLNTTQTKP